MQNTEGEPFDPQDLVSQAISNVITHVVFGDRFDYSDEKIANLQFQNYFAAHFKTHPFPILRVSSQSFMITRPADMCEVDKG